jgi:flagellar biosynthetic protein FliR
MDILSLIPTIYERLMAFILVFTRVSAMLSIFVLFRRELITGRIVISLAGILSIYVVLLYPVKAVNYDLYSIPMLTQELFQLFIGLIAGLIVNLVFEVFVAYGQIVSTQIGLGFASMIDPRFGSISNLTQFYMIFTALIFLYLNGHLYILKTIVDSFSVLPVYQNFVPTELISAVINYSGVIFSGAIVLSISLVIAMLLCNLALAVMTKFAPQFNLFSIGINMTLILGLLFAYMTFPIFMTQATNIIQDCFGHLHDLLAK